MATRKQVQAAKRNIPKAQQAARRKRTIAHLPESTRRELGKQAARGRRRHGQAGHALEDRNRQQLYEIAKEKAIPGRSKMGKWDLIKAIRKAR
jgi:Rho termination factor, N-terminal domain